MSVKKRIIFYFIMLLVLNNIIISQESRFRSSSQDGLYQEKIMTYNVLDYDGENFWARYDAVGIEKA